MPKIVFDSGLIFGAVQRDVFFFCSGNVLKSFKLYIFSVCVWHSGAGQRKLGAGGTGGACGACAGVSNS